MFRAEDLDNVHAAVSDLLLGPQIFNLQMSDPSGSAPASYANSCASIAVNAVKAKIFGNTPHAQSNGHALGDPMKFTLPAAQAEARLSGGIMLHTVAMIHNDFATGASAGLATTHEVSIDTYVDYYI